MAGSSHRMQPCEIDAMALAFGDVDVDKDGSINLEQFDRLLESVAAVPRRYGLAPVSTATPLERQMAQKKLFDQLDTKAGPARGMLGLDQTSSESISRIVSWICTPKAFFDKWKK